MKKIERTTVVIISLSALCVLLMGAILVALLPGIKGKRNDLGIICVPITISDSQTTYNYIEFSFDGEANGFELEDTKTLLTVAPDAKFNNMPLQLKRAGEGLVFHVVNTNNCEPTVGDTLLFTAGEYYNATTKVGVELDKTVGLVWDGNAWMEDATILPPAASDDTQATISTESVNGTIATLATTGSGGNDPNSNTTTSYNVTVSQEIKRQWWWGFEMFLEGTNIAVGPQNGGIAIDGNVYLDGVAIADPWFVVSDYDWGTGSYPIIIKTSDDKVWANEAAYNADKAAGTEHHMTIAAGTVLTADGKTYTVIEDANYRLSTIGGVYQWRYTTEAYNPVESEPEPQDQYVITAQSKIVIPSDASATIQFAAKELQRFIDETTGLTLPIVLQGTFVDHTVLNFSLDNQGACAAISNAKRDSYATVVDLGIMYVFGESDRAVLYGVYDFIETQLGVRFVSSDVTYIPNVSNVVIAGDYSVVETPAVDIRSYWTYDTQYDPVFAARKRLVALFEANPVDGGMNRDYYNPGHNLNALITSGGGTVSETTCLSNASTRAAIVAGMQNQIAANPSANYFALKIEDGYKPTSCGCADCVGKSDSDLLMALCNYVATEVNRTSNRDIYIVTYAYAETETPPTISVDSHVVVELAPIKNANFGYAYNDSRQTEAFIASVNGWKQKMGDRLWFYDYGTNYNNYSWYLSDLSLMLPNYQYFSNTLGCKAVIVEGNHAYQNDWQQALRVYVASKVMWDPNGYTQADVMNLVNEFCRLYFGESAGTAVYQYIVNMEAALVDIRDSGNYYVADSDHTLTGFNFRYDNNGVKHYLNANYHGWYTKDFLNAQISSLTAVYQNATGAEKNRLAQALYTAKLMYFANYKTYENKSVFFRYDTTSDSAFLTLKNEMSQLLTALDNGYAKGAYRSYYNNLLFKTMLEVVGTSTNATLVPGAEQSQAYLTSVTPGTAAGIYMKLEQNGTNAQTSGWNVVSGTTTAQIVSSTGASRTVIIKGTGAADRFFCDYDGFAGTPGDTAVITISAGTIVDNGVTWIIQGPIIIDLMFIGNQWTIYGT